MSEARMSALASVEALLGRYFDGLYEGDVAAWEAVFHPDCRFHTRRDDRPVAEPLADVFARMRTRQSPKAAGAARHDRIVLIDFSGPETALAKVECAVPPQFFTDYLTLCRFPGLAGFDGWRIVTKTYRTEARA
jgi:hypothetical protein